MEKRTRGNCHQREHPEVTKLQEFEKNLKSQIAEKEGRLSPIYTMIYTGI